MPPDVIPNKAAAVRPPPPPVAAPTRPVAITTAKIGSAPQALAPKRRRSFVGEPRPVEKGRPMEPGRGAPAPHKHKRGRTFQDEPTQARSLLDAGSAAARSDGGATQRPPVVDVSSAAAASAAQAYAPKPAVVDGGSAQRPPVEKTRPMRALDAPTFDDLDEDTRVLSTKTSNDIVDQAFQRLRASPPSSPGIAAPVQAPQAGEGILAEDTPEERTVVGTPSFAQQEAAALLAGRRGAGAPAEAHRAEGSASRADARETPEPAYRPAPTPPPISSSGTPTERPPAVPHAAPGFSLAGPPLATTVRAPAQKRLDTIPAVRVAVLATGSAGEVRLIALDGADDPPPGAALAILVPLGASDAEAVARLFASQD
jgi:hypothetical protein